MGRSTAFMGDASRDKGRWSGVELMSVLIIAKHRQQLIRESFGFVPYSIGYFPPHTAIFVLLPERNVFCCTSDLE
jgi:hypothetical protein